MYTVPFKRPCLKRNGLRYVTEAVARGHVSSVGRRMRTSPPWSDRSGHHWLPGIAFWN
jgi:hypothetical protein